MSLNSSQAERQILAVLAHVPAGKVVSYGQLADLAGLPRRARLAGRVLRTADTRHLPWHRVVAASGQLSLVKGSAPWLEQRQRLLSEGVRFKGNPLSGNTVIMAQYQWQPDLAQLLILLDY
ncbi:MGMT family protein [Oceanisphaera avium]|uniref:Cysteine methyltransferase n=1 Tax=Oceanisphaera avium TaxID=1903694 RepID=A0A1Y0CXA9_9GAMM|nr:MGMT family protein [Oceanisphaera avium]ART79526.1 cysteine methyltransferase [Oceanisphaera avium]